jgi:hypothetical protein
LTVVSVKDGMMQIDLDAETRLELASMVYGRWGTAYDNQKRVQGLTWESAGKFCPKADWPEFHGSMLEAAKAEFELATRLKNAVCKHSPIV